MKIYLLALFEDGCTTFICASFCKNMIKKQESSYNIEDTYYGYFEIFELDLKCKNNWKNWADEALSENIDIFLEVLVENVKDKEETYYKPLSLITFNPNRKNDPINLFTSGFSTPYIGDLINE